MHQADTPSEGPLLVPGKVVSRKETKWLVLCSSDGSFFWGRPRVLGKSAQILPGLQRTSSALKGGQIL